MSETPQKPDTDEISGIETTGHEWDGIKELDNPLPRWWLWIFYASIVYSVIYMVLMPALPALPGMSSGDSDHTRGVIGNSERANVARDLAALDAARADGFSRLEGISIEGIEADPQLLGFVRAAGQSAFGDNCGTCHGMGAQGAIGYPNLNDDVWLWGGSYDDIRTTIRFGIRTEHEQSRYSQMPAFGRDNILSFQEIRDVTDYVLSLAPDAAIENADAVARGRTVYDAQCASCHLADGSGDRAVGAPGLIDHDWLYGGTRDQIITTIERGPFGVMPAWEARLDEGMIDALTAYVYLLGGGESADPAE